MPSCSGIRKLWYIHPLGYRLAMHRNELQPPATMWVVFIRHSGEQSSQAEMKILCDLITWCSRTGKTQLILIELSVLVTLGAGDACWLGLGTKNFLRSRKWLIRIICWILRGKFTERFNKIVCILLHVRYNSTWKFQKETAYLSKQKNRSSLYNSNHLAYTRHTLWNTDLV